MSLSDFSFFALPALYALFIWWFSTGVIIYLDNLPRRTHRWSMLAATVILAVALHRLHATAGSTSVTSAYAAFTYGLLVWGWQEMSFFMGFITGPVREPCPPECTGWASFVRAVWACLYHELTSIAFGAAIVALTYGAPNQIGFWTYFVLWSMRMSAKLNVLLGVRNLNAEFIPEHLAFIRSFLRHRPMNLLFPFAVTAATIIAVLLVQRAGAPGIGQFAATGMTFVTLLLILAIIEHWFLVLPLPSARLWSWSLGASRGPAAMPGGRIEFSWVAAHSSWGAVFPRETHRLAALSVHAGNNAPIGGDP
jgi:putative photosynthetic complex assembly protein 2